MTVREKENIDVASKLLAGMLANPHIYTPVSDEEGRGAQEQLLLSNAIIIDESLIERVQQL